VLALGTVLLLGLVFRDIGSSFFSLVGTDHMSSCLCGDGLEGGLEGGLDDGLEGGDLNRIVWSACCCLQL
jgi:hypothetical protein